MHIVTDTIIKMAASTALGGLIGLERELHHKPAGLRTNMFICLGSTMFTTLSLEIAGKFHSDPERIAAQIIPGIGFIGAGAILREGMNVVGLTTAATIFVVAGIGMGVGYGYYGPSAIATGMIIAALFFLRFAERKLGTKFVNYQFSMSTRRMAEASERVTALLDEMKIQTEDVSWSREGEGQYLLFSALLSPDLQRELMRRLMQVKELEDIQSTIVTEK